MATKAENNRQFIHFTVGNKKVAFKGKSSIYSPLKSELGIDEISETLEDGYSEVSIRDMVNQGIAMVLTVSGSQAGKAKTGKLVCATDKLNTIFTSINGKNKKYGSWTISKIYQSGDRRTSY